MDENLTKALDDVSNKRITVARCRRDMESSRDTVDKVRRQLELDEKALETEQAGLNVALLNLRRVMSGLDSEVTVLPPTMDVSDQVGREG